MARNVRVIKDEYDPETPEVLAASIVKIANAFENLMGPGIVHQRAIVALLVAMPGMAGISKGEIDLILSNLKKLKSYYVR